MKDVQNNMTAGSPVKIIVFFTIPVFIGNVFQQFYNMADAVIVGKFVGTGALAAVGNAGNIMFLIYGFVSGLTTGFTVLTAQKFGVGDMKAVRQTVGTASALLAVIGSLLTAVLIVFMEPLLHLMNTPEDIFQDTYSYSVIISAGILAQILYAFLTSILRALGNSRIPLYFLTLCAALNIVLDIALVAGAGMGVAGAAAATVVSQAVSGVMTLLYIMRRVPVLKMERDDWKPRKGICRIQLGIGLPMAFQFSITAIGTFLVQISLNMLGSTFVAAFTAAGKIEQLVNQIYGALGTAIATYGAQNLGKGDVPRIRFGFKVCTVTAVIYSVVVGSVLFLFGKYMTVLFVSEDVPQIEGLVDIYLKCVGVFMIPLGIVCIYRSGLQGLGYGILPMLAGAAELVGRAIVSGMAAEAESYFGVCMAAPVAWVMASVLLLAVYYRVMKSGLTNPAG